MEMAKLDAYDYVVLPGVIRIKIQDNTDPIMVDIFSEIQNSMDLIYLEGEYYNFLREYDIVRDSDTNDLWLELEVVEILADLIPDILKTRR